MSERKTTDHLDIYEGDNYILITTTLSAGLELVDAVDGYIQQGFTVAASSTEIKRLLFTAKVVDGLRLRRRY